MAGLDPAIHLLPKILAKWMDARVKPAHDEFEFVTAPALQRTTPQRGGALRCVRGTIYFATPISLKYFSTPGWIRSALGAAASVFAAVVSHAWASFLQSCASAACKDFASR